MVALEDLISSEFNTLLDNNISRLDSRILYSEDSVEVRIKLEDKNREEYGFLRFSLVPGIGSSICSYVYVPEFYRGNGLGKELVKRLEHLSARLGFDKVQVKFVTNPQFWDYMGYRETKNYAEVDYEKRLTE